MRKLLLVTSLLFGLTACNVSANRSQDRPTVPLPLSATAALLVTKTPLTSEATALPTATSTPARTTTAAQSDLPTATATSSATATPTAWPTPTWTATSAPGPTATPNPSVTPPPSANEWTQFGGNAEHTAYTPAEVPTPWRLKWIWNGPNSSGGVVSGKFALPRNVQPVTGNGLVYLGAGTHGVVALNAASGAIAWQQNPGGSINSTVAYDGDTGAIFAVSSDGNLYKLSAANGNTLGHFTASGTSALPLPPVVTSDRVIFAMGNQVYALNKGSLAQLWAYDAGCPVTTPPAYSTTRNTVVVVAQDLYVNAINNATGAQLWRTKPTNRTGGDPAGSNTTLAESQYSWPVIAEVHGLVLVKYRLDWNALWTWNPWPTTNAAMRSNLASNPAYQAMFALSLTNGSVAFATNIGDGGWGDGNFLPMGPQAAVKTYADGSEVAYVIMRGTPCLPPAYCDGRGDSRFGEMLLDNTTVPGYSAGDVRFMQNTFFPTDEQAFLSVAGNDVFGGHWMFGVAHQIVNRSPSVGSSAANPITTNALPHVINSTVSCGLSASHYCAGNMTQDGDPRTIPGGFYIYYNTPGVYNQYHSSYAAWVISQGTVYFLSTDGALVAMENGNPTTGSAMAPSAQTAIAATVLPAGWVSAASQWSLQLASLWRSLPFVPAGAYDQPGAVIPFTQAAQYAGQVKTAQGVLRQVFNNGIATYLGFHNPHPGALLIRIMKASNGNFPGAAPQKIYQVGQVVRVTGQIGWYQGDPVIYVTDPSQIVVVGP